MAGHGDGHSQAPGLEGAGGVGALLFDEEAGIALAANHGGPALAEGDGENGVFGRAGGEDVAVAPHAERGGGGSGVAGGVVAVSCLFELVHVVTDVEGGAVRGEGLGRVRGEVDVGVAGGFEVGDRGHEIDATEVGGAWRWSGPGALLRNGLVG